MKKIIVGGGLSAVFTKIFIKSDDLKIISPRDRTGFNKKNLHRRKNFEKNKLFQKKSNSYGSLKFSIANTIFHDRLILGGNSNIWGGNFDIRKIPKSILNYLLKKGIFFTDLSFKHTGTLSNSKNIKQMYSLKDEIFDAKNLLLKTKNSYLKKFYITKKKIFLQTENSLNENNTFLAEKLFICVGSIQLLDLLYRSKLLKENDVIEFSEYSHKFKLKFFFTKIEKNAVIVRYKFSRAIGHFLGIQKFPFYLKIFNFIPLYIDQYFYYKKDKIKLKITNNIATEIKNLSVVNKFGSSIHYCNMKINNLSIRNYLKKIHPNIYGFGMSFVNQKKPGPISNDILIDIIKNLKKYRLNREIN